MVNFTTLWYAKLDYKDNVDYNKIANFKSDIISIGGLYGIEQKKECGEFTLLKEIKKVAEIYDGIIYYEVEDWNMYAVVLKNGKLTLYQGTMQFSNDTSKPQLSIVFNKKVDDLWVRTINEMEVS